MANLKRSRDSGYFYVLEDDGTRRDPTPAELAAKGVSQPTGVKRVQEPLKVREVDTSKSALSFTQQVVHDVLALNPDKQVEYVKSLGFKVRRGPQGEPYYSPTGEPGTWKAANKKGFDRRDAANIAIQAAASLAPGGLAVKAGLKGPQALAAMAAGTGAVEFGREALGQAMGVPGNISPRRIAAESALTAALPLAATGIARGTKAIFRPLTRGTRRLEPAAMSVASGMAGLTDTGVQAEDALRFRMANRQNTPSFIQIGDELSELIKRKNVLVPEAAQAAQMAKASQAPTDMRGVIAALNRGIGDPENSPAVQNSLRQTRDVVLNRVRRMRGIAKQYDLTATSQNVLDPAMGQSVTRQATRDVLDDPVAVDMLMSSVPAAHAQRIKRLLQKEGRFAVGEAVTPEKAGARPALRAAASETRRAMEKALPQMFADLNFTASEKNAVRNRLLKAIRAEGEFGGATPTTESFLKALFNVRDNEAKQRFLKRFDAKFGTDFLRRTREAQIGSMWGGPGGQPETRIFTTATGGLKGQALARSAATAALGAGAGSAAGGLPGGLLGAGAGLAMATPGNVLRTARGIAAAQNATERFGARATVPFQDRRWAQALMPALAGADPAGEQASTILSALLELMGRRQESDLLQGGP